MRPQQLFSSFSCTVIVKMFSAVSHDDFVGNIWIICKVYANKLGIAFLRSIFYMRLNVYFLPIIIRKSAISESLPRRRFSVVDQSEHFTAKPPLKK